MGALSALGVQAGVGQVQGVPSAWGTMCSKDKGSGGKGKRPPNSRAGVGWWGGGGGVLCPGAAGAKLCAGNKSGVTMGGRGSKNADRFVWAS